MMSWGKAPACDLPKCTGDQTISACIPAGNPVRPYEVLSQALQVATPYSTQAVAFLQYDQKNPRQAWVSLFFKQALTLKK
jgi:hypothetical protein